METIQGSYPNHAARPSQSFSKTLEQSRNHPGTPDGLNIQGKSLRISRYPGLPPLLAKRTLTHFRINNDLIKTLLNIYNFTLNITKNIVQKRSYYY